MGFAPNDRKPGHNDLNNQGTISTDGFGWAGNPWGAIGGLNGVYPFPGFTPPLVTVTPASHQNAGTLTAGTETASSDTTSSSDVLQPLPGPLTSANPKFDIIINYDSSITNLQTQNATLYGSITTAISAAVGFYETEITNKMTVQIDFGWGEEQGQTIAAGAISQSSPGFGNTIVSYSSLVSALETHDPSLAGELPASNPVSGADWDVYQAQAVALGLESLGPGSHPLIGYVGLSDSVPFTFDPNNRAVTGDTDAIGALEHEISEVLGRVDILGTETQPGTPPAPLYTVMDLLRFDGVGSADLTAGGGSYISLDNGTTSLGALANSVTTGDDPGDWASSVPDDSYDAEGTAGTANLVSANDLSLLNALGYTIATCFVAGTRIRTARGAVRVEDLSAGELVHTRFARLAPIRWIGRRRIDCRRHPDPQQVWPIRIVANAFAPGRPERDLLLSPDHAVAAGDALIPIRLLVNGATIRQETGWPHVHYFHVELDRHDLLFSEGLETESYLDTGNRGTFENADTAFILHPLLGDAAAQARREGLSCLPFRNEPDQVLPAWRALAARAEALGFVLPAPETTDDPALRILAGTDCFVPLKDSAGRHVFILPALQQQIRLTSRAASPAASRPWLHDRRHLGVRISAITVTTPESRRPMALDDPRLTDGWWDVEHDGAAMRRWTNGSALLPHLEGPCIVELTVSDTVPYILPKSAASTARAA